MARTVTFTDTEFMIAQGSRLLEDGKSIFVGWGIPQVVAMLAQKIHTPNIIQLFEFGAIGPQPALPFVRGTMGGPQNTYRSLQWLNMNWAFAYSASGYMDYGMLGALQVDPYGNVNSTYLGGTFEKPERRFAGSGGGNQVASHCWKTIIVIKHEGRRFVPKVEFLTSPGYLSGPGAREKAGLPAETGPYRVVTSKALFGFDEESKRMTLLAVLRGLSPEAVVRDMAFRPLVAKEVGEIAPPTEDELRVLREEIDPSRIIIRGETMTSTA
ncbi:MAG: acyl CoA--acetate/3-ketoacid CoA transferase subunit beta [Deltaproteobacteria bacterium]|nr:acyl CoA--acetate/3-ketoacid CoA transferase subunit beta [Deltaproteobacteria bacterium]